METNLVGGPRAPIRKVQHDNAVRRDSVRRRVLHNSEEHRADTTESGYEVACGCAWLGVKLTEGKESRLSTSRDLHRIREDTVDRVINRLSASPVQCSRWLRPIVLINIGEGTQNAVEQLSEFVGGHEAILVRRRRVMSGRCQVAKPTRRASRFASRARQPTARSLRAPHERTCLSAGNGIAYSLVV